MKLKKNDICEIEIKDIGINGEGIGKIDNFTIFVNNALPEEIVKIKILKLKKSYGYGKLIEIVSASPKREIAPCKYFSLCGGCNLQHLKYEDQLILKANLVKNNLKKIAKIENPTVFKTLGMEDPFNYRNKAQIPVNKKNNTVNIGFFSPRTHNIINIDKCIIQDEFINDVIKKFRDFMEENKIEPYEENSHLGLVRHIVTRTSKDLSQFILCIVINSKSIFKYKNELIEKFKNFKNLKGIIINFNPNKTNVILGKKTEVIYGKNYIVDYIQDLRFKISMESFYQVNPVQTEILYNKVMEFASLSGEETVIDAYCGIGTISLFLAKNSKKVYGIEIVEEAIKDAVFNANENNIKNAEFILGKSEQVIPDLIKNRGICPDVIVVDPPRKGCDESLLKTIVKENIKKIIYVSCNPATLARDVSYLAKNGYILEKAQPVDMFCLSTHVETVVLMSRVKVNTMF